MKILIFVWDKNTGRLLSGLLWDEGYNNQFYNADLEYGERRDILKGLKHQFKYIDPTPVFFSVGKSRRS